MNNDLKRAIVYEQIELFNELKEERKIYHKAFYSFYDYLNSVNFKEFKLNDQLFSNSDDLFCYLDDLKEENPEEFNKVKKLKEPINFDEFYKKADNLLCKLAEKELNYKTYFINYVNKISDYHEKLFSKEYLERVYNLCKEGVFLFLEDVPVFEEELTDDPKANAKMVIEYYKKDDYKELKFFYRQFLNIKEYENYLEEILINELKEAFVCLQNKCYSSCARTLFALIEHDFRNASNIPSQYNNKKYTTGTERAEHINKQIKNLNYDYLTKQWKELDDYYGKLTKGLDFKVDGFINRNELDHGAFEDATLPDADWCIKLFLIYASFNQMNFFLQEFNELRIDLKITLFRI